MNRTSCPAVLGVLGALTLASTSTPALAVDSSQNAALRYWHAWALLSDKNIEAIGEASSGDIGAPDFVLSADLKELVKGDEARGTVSSDVVELLVDAAAFEECDFAIDTSAGLYTLIPHMNPMRKSVTLLGIDARRLMGEGQVDEAVGRLEAAYRTAEHSLGDYFMISTLVSYAMFAQTQAVTDYALNAGLLDNAQRQRLLDAIDRFEGADPFRFQAALRAERALVGGWMREEVNKRGPDALIALLSTASDDPETVASTERLRARLAEGHADDLMTAQLDLYDALMGSAIESWTDAEKVGEIDESVSGLCEGDRAPLACLMMPSLSKLHERYETSLEMFAGARGRLAP